MNGNLIIELLNNSNFYIVILDKEMNIRFANQTFITRLGYSQIEELLGKCWLEFVPEKIKENIKAVHASIIFEKSDKYNEYTNKVLNKDGLVFLVKWFNTLINHETNWSLSFGLPQQEEIIVTEETIRKNFRNRIESDKTLIKSLKSYVNDISEQFKINDECHIPAETENTF